MKKYYIGDLVRHIKDNRVGVVISDSTPLQGWGVPVCDVVWSDNHSRNLMDISLLSGIPDGT